MKLTNYLDHNVKSNILSTSMLATAGGLIYYEGINESLSTAIAFSLIAGFFSRNILDKVTETYSRKCDTDHPIYKTVISIIDENECFSNLKKIDVFILDSNSGNAFACGFGKINPAIYVNTGLIKCFGNDYSDNRLKAILAHELGHISGDHIFLKTIINTFNIVNDYLLPIIPIPGIEDLLGILNKLLISSFSRQIEYDADRIATDCGFGPDLFDALIEITYTPKPHKDCFSHGLSLNIEEFFSTHPSIYNRAAAINAHLIEENTEYDNWYDWFTDSMSHTFSRFIDQYAIHNEVYSRMIGLTEELNQHRLEHI